MLLRNSNCFYLWCLKGVSLIQNLDKFDSLFGVNIRQYISSQSGMPGEKIIFLNDATCFALGEYFYGAIRDQTEQQRRHDKCIFLTIGSGFGSTFLDQGRFINSGDTVPLDDGLLYRVAYKTGIAEDFFSQKWILKRHSELEFALRGASDELYRGVSDLPDDDLLERVFVELAQNLAEFILPWIHAFEATCLCLGGNVIKYKVILGTFCMLLATN